jgi:hypothetical protein
LVGSIAAAAAITVAGAFVWKASFAASAAASAAAILVTIPVTVLIVETIVDRRRDEQWVLVREQTGRRIEALAQEAAFDFHVTLTPERRQEIPSPAVLPPGGHAASLRAIESALRERRGEADPDPAVIRLHDTIRRPLFYLGEMAPRIYASSDPTIARLFGDLEEEVGAWDRARYLHEDQHPEVLWENAADTAAALASLVEHAHSLR